MTISPDQPHRRLLFGLLDRYERGVCFGQPSGWAREPTLFWDERSFPDAFAPEGYELLTTLSAAAAQLEANGCLRIVRHSRGPLRGEPKELRLGSAQLDAAYRAADSLGYFRLAQAFEAISSVASVLSGPGFVFAYFHELVPALRRLDASLLGVSRQRLKLEYPNICRALTAAVALANGVAPAYERIISDRIFGNSKTLSRVRDLTASLLVRMDPRWEGVSQISTADLLEAYGVRRRPALIQCAGRGSLHINGRTYELDDFTPVAHLPESWTEAFVEAATNAGLATVTTVENEYPFLSYIESHGGSAAVGSTGELVVYTGRASSPHFAPLAAKSRASNPPHLIIDCARTSICSVSSVYWPALSFHPGHPICALP